MKKVIVVLALLGLGGCQTVKNLEATGGSRADGIVELSFEHGPFEQPVIQWEQGDSVAAERCRSWGYASAARFGGTKSTCQDRDCMRRFVTIPYQCTGGNK